MMKERDNPINPELPHDFNETVDFLGQLRGITGLSIEITPSEHGSHCKTTETGLSIVVDPSQVAIGNGGEQLVSPYVTALFIANHETGHAADMMDPSWSTASDGAQHFFEMLTDDAVIDTQARLIPLFDAYADDVYSSQMDQDLSELPLHVQLMMGIRLTAVMSTPDVTVDPKVEKIINELQDVQLAGRSYDIIAAICNEQTDLGTRRAYATRYIWDAYRSLFIEDEQTGQGNSGDNGQPDFSAVYEDYENAVHAGHDHHEAEPESDSEAGDSSESSNTSLAQQITDLLKNSDDSEESNQVVVTTEDLETEEAEAIQRIIDDSAERIGVELELDSDNAHEYAKAAYELRHVIGQVSDVFMKLAEPFEQALSPRFERRSSTSGVVLHSARLVQAGIQQATRQEQSIWRPIKPQAMREALAFSGRDVQLLVDTTSSMAFPRINASEDAAKTALCLLEGLQLAKYKSDQLMRGQQADVRVGVIAFANSSKVLAGLSHEASPTDKGRTFVALRNPSGSTYINGALKEVLTSANKSPERTVLTMVITDADNFYDYQEALSTIATLPSNVHLSQLSLGNNTERALLTTNNVEVANPSTLPLELYRALSTQIGGV